MASVNEIMRLCRLCLVKDEVNIPIFDEQGDIRQIFLKISACLPVKVSREDNLPKNICDGCSSKLESLYQFWNTSANSEKKLIRWLSGERIERNAQQQQHSMIHDPVVLKQEVVEVPDDGASPDHMDDLNASNDADYLEQQLPYENVEFQFQQDDYDETGSDAVVESGSRKRRAAAIRAIASMGSEDEGNPDLLQPKLAKIEEESDDSGGEDPEPTAFVGLPSATDNDQPGPSGVGKQSADAPFVVWQLYRVLEVPQSVDKGEKKSEEHKCGTCGAAFAFLFLLRDHMKNEHANVKCRTCFKWFVAQAEGNAQCSDCEAANPGVSEPDSGAFGFRCDICDKRWWSERTMQYHRRSVHGNSQFHPCKICGKPFKKFTDALAHEGGHRGLNMYKCEVCGTTFSFSMQLDYHTKKAHTEVTRFKCDQCERTFRYPSLLKYHKTDAHDSVAHYQCADCGNTYRSKGNLNAHRRIHRPDYVPQKFTCKVCHAIFASRPGYRHHRKTHELNAGGKSFVCETCGKSITTLSSFVDHVRTHTGEKPFQCHDCGKAFGSKKSFIMHTRVHTKEKPYKCRLCDARFTQCGSLTIHVRKHTGDCPFTCHVCAKTFPVKTLLRTHMKRHTNCKDDE